MYRQLFKNNKTNEKVWFWATYKDDGMHYSTKLSFDEEVDISDYDIISCNDSEDNLETCFKLFGVECGSGWYQIIQPIVDYIDEYNKDKEDNEKIEITQIKEKYGTLRFYTNFGTKELWDLIDKAEAESEITCEVCGSKENVGTTLGWLQTICYPCLKKQCKDRGLNIKYHSYKDDKVYLIGTDKDELIDSENKEI